MNRVAPEGWLRFHQSQSPWSMKGWTLRHSHFNKASRSTSMPTLIAKGSDYVSKRSLGLSLGFCFWLIREREGIKLVIWPERGRKGGHLCWKRWQWQVKWHQVLSTNSNSQSLLSGFLKLHPNKTPRHTSPSPPNPFLRRMWRYILVHISLNQKKNPHCV